jgi:hypothetical protein
MEVEDADIPKGGKKCATNKVENGNIYIYIYQQYYLKNS